MYEYAIRCADKGSVITPYSLRNHHSSLTSRTGPSPHPKRTCYSPILSDHHLIELTPVNSGTKSNPHNPPSSPTSEGKGNGGAIREAGRWELAVISHIYATIIGPTASLALQRSDRPLSGLGCTAWHLSSFAMIFPRLSEFSLDYLPELRFAVSPIYIDKGWSYMCVA